MYFCSIEALRRPWHWRDRLYRPDEQITLTNLGDMLKHPIDMLTTVIIGQPQQS